MGRKRWSFVLLESNSHNGGVEGVARNSEVYFRSEKGCRRINSLDAFILNLPCDKDNSTHGGNEVILQSKFSCVTGIDGLLCLW